MHKQGDQVVYVESGLESNALVISSVSQPDFIPGQEPAPDAPVVEHLGLVTIPHHTQGVSNLFPIANGYFGRTIFGVRPLSGGSATGWKEGTAQSDPAAIAAVKSGYGRALTGTQSPVLLAQIDGEEGSPATQHVVQQTQPYYEGRPSGMHAVTFVDSAKPTMVYEPEGTKPVEPTPAPKGPRAFLPGEGVNVDLGGSTGVKHGEVTDTPPPSGPEAVPDGSVHVKFDDGEEQWVSSDMIQTLPAKPLAAIQSHDESAGALAVKPAFEPAPSAPVPPPAGDLYSVGSKVSFLGHEGGNEPQPGTISGTRKDEGGEWFEVKLENGSTVEVRQQEIVSHV